MREALQRLLSHPGIWRGRLSHPRFVVPSGYPRLDRHLPGGGWPVGALTEIAVEHWGIGELRLLLPALAYLTAETRPVAGKKPVTRARWIAWIAPPYIPYAPTLVNDGVDISRMLLVHPRSESDGLWAMEQALRSGTCAAVLAWIDRIDEHRLRRLQLAAEAGESWGVIFRSPVVLSQTSPAALRLRLTEAEQGLQVQIVKNRGGRLATAMLDLNALEAAE